MNFPPQPPYPVRNTERNTVRDRQTIFSDVQARIYKNRINKNRNQNRDDVCQIPENDFQAVEFIMDTIDKKLTGIDSTAIATALHEYNKAKTILEEAEMNEIYKYIRDLSGCENKPFGLTDKALANIASKTYRRHLSKYHRPPSMETEDDYTFKYPQYAGSRHTRNHTKRRKGSRRR